MFSSVRSVFVALLFCILVLAFLYVSPALAATGSISWTGTAATPGAACGLSGPRLDFSVTGTTDDDGAGNDDVSLEVVDGNGVVIFSGSDSVPVGSATGAAGAAVSIGGITARPITARLIDDPAGTVIASDTIDPAGFVPDCANLPLVGGGGTTPTTSGEPAPGPPFIPGDDRLNVDPASPVSIYCRDDGIHVFSIDNKGQGREIFVATLSEINAVGIPSVNTLIDSGAGVGLYRLTSGQFQVNSTRASSAQPKVQAQEIGQTIIHTVQRGENLFRIALRYGTTVAEIARLNGIADPTRIFVGQQLTIVVGSRGAPGTAGTQGVTTGGGISAGYVFIFGGC